MTTSSRWSRASALAVTAVLAMGATGGQVVASADDPCGDILWTGDGDEPTSHAPDDWDAFDVRGVEVAEYGGGGDREVRVTLELCGPAVDPERPADQRYYRMEWPTTDGCRRGFMLSHRELLEDTSVGGVQVSFGALRQVFESCPDPAGQPVVGSHRLVAELTDEHIEIEGDHLTVWLRAADLGALADIVAPGATWTDVRVSTRASSVPLVGGTFCMPVGNCGRLGGGDTVDLGSVTLGG